MASSVASETPAAAAARRARAAQPLWAARGFDGRARVLLDLRDWLVEHREEMLEALMEESGKTRGDALVTDWTYVCTALDHWAHAAEGWLQDERVPAGSPLMFGRELTTRFVPHGLIGVIGPWNFPLSLCFGDAIPALMAGCAVLLKPASLTTQSTELLARGWAEVGGPPEVLGVVTGPGAGAAVVDEVDFVMFTGSAETGRTVAVRCAERLIGCTLELGGNDPMLVLADADLDRAVSCAVHGGMFNAGQVCQSVERVYVEEPVYDEFLERLVAHVRRLRMGTDIGAMTDPAQEEIVAAHVADAVERGARLLAGGDGPEPTVLADCEPDMRVMREETFGPVLAVAPVADAEEAVTLANDSDYGLSASVFTTDATRGERVARSLEAGGVYVNDVLLNALAFDAPFGGWKSSGVGARNGPDGIRKYCRRQLVGVTRVATSSEIYHYPLDEDRAAMLERTMVFMQKRAGRAVGGALSLVGRTPVVKVAELATSLDRRRRHGPRR